MADTDGQVVIRVPVLLRVWTVAFLVFWCAQVGWTTMVRHHGSSVLIGCALIAFAAALGYRLFRMGVRADSTGQLVVRNPAANRRFTRSDIEGLRISTLTGRGPFRATGIVVLLRDGTVLPMAVTQSAPWRRRSRQERDLARLRAWLAEP